MKKVGILTFHGANNYGSVLQAFALSRMIEKLGFEVEIVNYVPNNQEDMYKIFIDNKSIKALLKNVMAAFFHPVLKNKSEGFEKFRAEYLNVGKKCYKEKIAIGELDEQYEYVICGSDQIWNIIAADFSEEYLLPNVRKARKIAYAPSLSTGDFCGTRNEEKFRQLIDDFDFLSVREYSGKEKLEKLLKYNREVEVVIDPTLLLEREDYESISSNRVHNGKYIFFYSIDYNSVAVEIVKYISKKINLPIIVMFTSIKTYTILGKGFRISRKASPSDFLSLIRYADLVLTTSFHGTAFSVIFEKEFFAVMRNQGDEEVYYDPRICNLLGKLNLNERIITEMNYQTMKYQGNKLDYSKVRKQKEELQNNSVEYLKNCFRK